MEPWQIVAPCAATKYSQTNLNNFGYYCCNARDTNGKISSVCDGIIDTTLNREDTILPSMT